MSAARDPATEGASPANGRPSPQAPAPAGAAVSVAETTQVPPQVPPEAPVRGPLAPGRTPGPVDLFMSALIRKLSWSRLSDPRVAVAVSGVGLLFGMLVAATAPNAETIPSRLPLSQFLPSLEGQPILSMVTLYTGDILACLGLAGMLWAHSQGWRPDPRRLLLVSAGIVALMVCLTPAGSSDTASYAAYGRIAAQGGNPYTTSPQAWGDLAYLHPVGVVWKNVPSVYGPVATFIQSMAASIGGPNATATIWVLMVLNGVAFIGVGLLLLKTSSDPLRATLFWTANPVLIQQLVSGGHLDTFVAAAAICAIQVARLLNGWWSDILAGALIGLACGIKATGVLVAVGLAWPLLRRREWARLARMTAAGLAVVVPVYSYYGLVSIRPLLSASKLVAFPSPWRVFQVAAETVGVSQGAIATVITVVWPVAMVVVAWLVYQRISSDQPREIVAPFAVTFAWILVAPWVLPWYTAIAWVTLTQVPRNRMTRWLTIVTVTLALWRSSGGQVPPAGWFH